MFLRINTLKVALLFIGLLVLSLVVYMGNILMNANNHSPTRLTAGIYNENTLEEENRTDEGLSLEIQKKIKTLLIFIGYPRSGHTLIGSLLDAHPHIVIANEFNMLPQWQNWSSRQRNIRNLCNRLYENSRSQSEAGYRAKETKKKRSYFVPRQWQGKFKDFIKVIGDKKGGLTTRFLNSNMATLRDLSRNIKLQIKMVHVVRNPYDNIATMIRRRLHIKKSTTELMKNPINNTSIVQEYIAYYNYLAFMNTNLLKIFGSRVITIYSEDVIRKPVEVLKKLCRFLNVKCSNGYLNDCASIIYKTPSKTRYTVVWSQESVRIMRKKLPNIPFLKRYFEK